MLLSNERAKPTLLEQMAATPRYRLNGLPEDTRHVVIFAERSVAAAACAAVAEHCPHAVIEGVCLHKGREATLDVCLRGRQCRLPVLDPAEAARRPHCLAVLYWQDCIVPHLLYFLETIVRRTLSIAIFPRIPTGTGRKEDATLYECHGNELEALYAALGDDESRMAFASVVKGLLTGEIDWLRPPVCPEYRHPAACARPGDIIVDAGLFDSTVLRRFALDAGPDGHVYGFEPEPANYDFVRQTLRRFGDPGNVTLLRKGLYSRSGAMYISALGPSGALSASGGEGTSPCEVVSLDDFVNERRISRVDLVKMDIEGAEAEALRGASATLRAFRPRLHVCAYHHIEDIVTLPRLICDIVPEYRFFFAAHAPYLNEYVYYAVAPSQCEA